jgi:hypothetical protein
MTPAAKEDAMIDAGSAGRAVDSDGLQVDSRRNGALVPVHDPDAKARDDAQGSHSGTPEPTGARAEQGDGIAGMSVLRGLVVYGAVLAFAGLYTDFVILISRANGMASIEPALLTAAAALAGVLGSAFALRVGNPSPQAVINQALKTRIDNINNPDIPTTAADKVKRIIHEGLSLEVSAPNKPSWPITIGIWVYALVGSAVAVTYALNERQTPGPVKALAVTFAGYVVALLSVAFGVQSASSNAPTS